MSNIFPVTRFPCDLVSVMSSTPKIWVWPQAPLAETSKHRQGGWGEEGGGGWGAKGCGLREGSSSAMGGERGGPSKAHLGLDPQLEALNDGPDTLHS